MESTDSLGRRTDTLGRQLVPRTPRTLPFAPLQAAIDDANRRRHRTLAGFLPEPQRRAYHRAQTTGVIALLGAEALCDAYGWHPREIWGPDGPWDQHATRKRTRGKKATAA